jgi:membrane fusion protein (multidrug efflux system)
MASFTLGACDSKKGGHAEVMVQSHPLQQDTTISREYGCQINACRNIKVTAPERGYLKTGDLKEGQRVNAGDVLFKIVPGSSRIALNRAEAVAEVAKAVFENTERRLKNQQATDQELREAKDQWDEKLALVKVAQSDEGVNMIKAPFSGLMGRLLLPEGSLVEQGAVLTTLTDNSEMRAFFNVSEAEHREYAAQAQTGENKQVTLVLANGKVFDQPGRLDVTEAKAGEENGMVPLRADFANPTGLLRNGVSGIVRVWKMVKQAVLVPQNATFEKRGHHYVFVVGKDQVMKQREIKISAELEGLFVVSEGVGADDTIVFAGLGLAKDGAKADGVEFEAPEKAFAHLKFKRE